MNDSLDRQPRASKPSRADRITLGVMAVVAAAASLVGAFLHFASGFGMLAPGATHVHLLTRMEVPNAGTPGVGDAPGIVSAGFESAAVVATGLSDGARFALGAGILSTSITILIVGGAVAWLLAMVAASRPFGRSLRATTLAAGFALTLGPILSLGLTGFGQMQAADELNHLADGIFVVGFSAPLLGLALPLAGLAVLALSYVFHVGARLQRDTEGLV